jgi:hypothetical protein
MMKEQAVTNTPKQLATRSTPRVEGLKRCFTPWIHIALVALLATVWCTSQASAETALSRVELKDGSFVKGEILVMETDVKVVIQVPGEEKPRSIAWADIDHMDTPVSPKAMGTVSGEEYTESPQAVGNNFHITTEDRQVQLYEITDVATGYVSGSGGAATVSVQNNRLVCTTPCDAAVDGSRGQFFFFAGKNVTASDTFQLNGMQGDIQARVEAGSATAMGWGTLLVTLGLTSALTGGSILLTESLLSDLTEDDESIFGPTAPILLATGGAMLTGGIVLWVTNGTDYELSLTSTGRGVALQGTGW